MNDTLQARLDQIEPERLKYIEREKAFFEDEFNRIDACARENGWINTAIALRAARALHSGQVRGRVTRKDGTTVARPYFCHCLSVCRLLINLPIFLPKEEMDIMLAAALCHDVPAYVPQLCHNHGLSELYHMDSAVSELITLIYTRDCVTPGDFMELFRRVSANRLALLIKLADRAHVVESLYRESVWTANQYIEETRTYYIPLCIYGREVYPELDRALGVLLGKLHDLIDATDIFLKRYTDLEREYITEILQLKEDNAMFRTHIRRMREGE